MKLAAFSRSATFSGHLRGLLDPRPVVADRFPRCGDDLVLLVHLPSLRGDEREQLAGRVAGCRWIALSDRPDLDEMLDMLRLGARGYANSFLAADNLKLMLDSVAQGQIWMPPGLQQQAIELARRALDHKPALSLSKLTEREREIAEAVAEGLSNREIGGRFNITERTVKSHLSNIFRKLGVRDRMALIVGLRAA